MKQLRHILSVGMLIALISSASAQSWLTNGLVAYYPFNGNANDESGNGNDALPHNVSLVSNRFGNVSAAYSFNQPDNYIETPVVTSTNTYTISIWAFCDASGYRGIVGNDGENWYGKSFYLLDATPVIYNVHPYYGFQIFAHRPVIYNKWQHLCISVDSGVVAFYLNGIENGSFSGIESYGTNWFIGGKGVATSQMPFSGMLDDVRIYNRALSSNEVAELYALEAPVPPTFMLQPQSVTAVAGSSTNLSVTATGSDALRYQWLKDGVILPGATNAALLFSNLQPVNVGDYLAVVSNGGGSVTSSVASVSIPGVNSGVWQGLVAYYPFNGNANDESGFGNDLASINTSPAISRFATPNASVHIAPGGSITAVNGHLSFAFDDSITVSGWVQLQSYHQSYDNILGVGTGDCGGWGLGAFLGRYDDPKGRINHLIFADVIHCQEGSETESSMELRLKRWYHFARTHQSGTNHCFINGAEVGSFVWLPSQGFVKQGRHFRIGRSENPSGMMDADVDDYRIYNRVLSSNEVAQLYALEAPVPPTFTLQPQSVTAGAGSSTNLSVTATGSELLTYQWLKDGVALPGATNASLLFSNLQPVNVGDFAAVVSNGGGSVTSSVASVSIPGVNSGLWQGLVAYYPFNGNANDETGFGNDGTLHGPSLGSDRLGVHASSYFFSGEGSPDNIEITKTNILDSDNYTVSLWFNAAAFPTDSPASYAMFLISRGRNDVELALGCPPFQSKGIRFLPRLLNPTTGQVVDVRTAVNYQTNFWYQLIATYEKEGSLSRLFLNGNELEQTAYTGGDGPPDIRSIKIGMRYNAVPGQGLPFKGSIDDVRIYNRALSTNEVAQLYALEAPISPSITAQPQSLTAAAGSFTNLSLTATGGGVLTYQWWKDGVALPDATNASLVLANLQPVNIGDYMVVVRNGGGSLTSSVASVSIPGVNSGLWQGLVAYYPFNGNANDESGFGRDGVQTGVVSISDRYGAAGKAMFFDGIAGHHIEIPDSTALLEQRQPFSISSWVRLDRMPAGINSSILSFWGVFAILATDITGANTMFTEISGDAFLRSAFPLDPSPNHFHLLVTFNGTTQSTYLNGAQLQTTDDSQSVTFPPRNLVIGGDLYDEDKQTFNGVIDDVRIYNRALSSNDVAALYQSEVPPPTPPAITQNPTDVVATALSPVEFTAAAYSFYPFTYQWQLNGTNLLYATNSTLSILSARQSNLGQYTLIASNAYGSVTSSAANLFLYPYLNAPFTGVVTYWGQTNTLSVGAWGSGSLAYQWYFNGTAIAGATNTTLPLGGIQFTNAGQYSVVVSNSLGSVTNTPYQVVVNPANISLGLFAGVIIQGTVGYNYTIQATTDLSTTNSWATVTNITLADPIQIWFDGSSDVHSAGNPQKFYQVIPGQ